MENVAVNEFSGINAGDRSTPAAETVQQSLRGAAFVADLAADAMYL